MQRGSFTFRALQLTQPPFTALITGGSSDRKLMSKSWQVGTGPRNAHQDSRLFGEPGLFNSSRSETNPSLFPDKLNWYLHSAEDPE
jgi:hypothetical protein